MVDEHDWHAQAEQARERGRRERERARARAQVERERAHEARERFRIQGGRGRPRGTTRERILDIALELFNEQGYDKTSLREISEELGFTKAALYYHFPSKEDILLALHLRLHEIGHDLIDRLVGLGAGPQDPANWDALVDNLIDKVAANRKLFLVHERNHGAFDALSRREEHQHEHDDLERQFDKILANGAVPLADRVRLAAAVGVVMSVLMGVGIGSGEAFDDVPTEELARLVREAVHDLRHPARSGPRAPRR